MNPENCSTVPVWKSLLAMCKVKITGAVMITVAVGYILESGHFEMAMVLPIIGTFLLAAGAFTLNQLQEVRTDALMDRTKNRPLPAGLVTPLQAALQIIALFIAGGLITWLGGNLWVTALGFFTIFWYNGIYVYLKRISSLAVVPGSLVGSIPPMIGWAASAGGNIFDPRIMAVALFIFVWQIPHFWLLLLLYGKQYETAGLPSLTAQYSNRQLAGSTCAGFFVSGVCGIVVSSPLVITHYWGTFVLTLAFSLWLIWRGFVLFQKHDSRDNFRAAFRDINIYTLVVLVFFSVDQMIFVR